MKGLKTIFKLSLVIVVFAGISQLVSCEEPLEECLCTSNHPYSTDGSDTCYETKEICEDNEGVACFVCL